MRVFLYEYACAQKNNVALPDSVRTEGQAMLSCLVEDFGRVPDVEVLMVTATEPQNEEAAFKTLAAQADWSLVIAPEFDDLLLTRCDWVEAAGGRLLGPSCEAVRVAADKWETYKLLHTHGIPAPRTWLGKDPTLPDAAHGPTICKPRWGAGSQGVSLLASGSDVPADADWLVQEFVPGVAASVAFLAGPTTVMALAPAYQLLSTDGTFRYLGGRLPLSPDLVARATTLARRALEVLPGAFGYLGVDLVLGETDGSGDVVIEINPRLTTSYVGLRELAEDNLAEWLLRIAAGETPLPLRWRRGPVEIRPDGVIRHG